MKRLVFTLLASAGGFAAIVSLGTPAWRESPCAQGRHRPVVIACQPGHAEDRLARVAM